MLVYLVYWGWDQGHGADRTVLPVALSSKSQLGLSNTELKTHVKHLKLGRKEPRTLDLLAWASWLSGEEVPGHQGHC